MRTKKLAALCLTGAMVISMLTGCGINKNEVVVTYNNGEVTMGLVNFLVRYEQTASTGIYEMYFGEDPWNSDAYGAGSTMGDSLKEDIIEEIHEMVTLRDHMSEYGVSLSDEEKSAITNAAKAFMSANDAKTLQAMGATQEIVEEVLSLYTIQHKMHHEIIADVDTVVSDEEANMTAYTMVRFNTGGYYDSSYNYVAYTEEEAAEIKAQAEEFYAAVTDPAELEAIAEEKGYSASTGTYDADDTSLEEAVRTALEGLDEGQMAELITTDSASYVVRLDAKTDEEATEENRQDIIAEREDTLYDDTLSGWQEEDNWTVKERALAKIDFKDVYTIPSEESTESDEAVETEDTEESVEEVESTEADAE